MLAIRLAGVRWAGPYLLGIRLLGVAVTVCWALGLPAAAGARTVRLLGCDFSGILYDVDPLTGLASNPRDTGIPNLAGIAYSPDGVLYGLTTFGGNRELENSLFAIDAGTGESRRLGKVGFTVVEGGLAFDRRTGILYGLLRPVKGIFIGPYRRKALFLGHFVHAPV